MKLSIITALYRSSDFLESYYNQITNAARSITSDYELIFVNDGSPDDSFDRARRLMQKDASVKIVDLSRNFGHHKAVVAALEFAKGDRILFMDCDLEEDPNLLTAYWQELDRNPEYDAVYGVWTNDKGGWFERTTRALFFLVFNILSDVKIPVNLGFSRLVTRRFADALLANKESEVFLGGLWFSVGFLQKPLPVEKKELRASTYTFLKKMGMLVDAITSFSSRPLVYVFGLGLTISFFSILVIIYLLVAKYFLGLGIPGWVSILISIWFVGGLIIFSIGVLGIYISKMFIEIKRRPSAIVRSFYDKDKSEGK